MDLSHIMLIDDINPNAPGRDCLLFNALKVSEEEARALYQQGRASPYVLAMPKSQFLGLFRNETVTIEPASCLDAGHGDTSVSGTLRKNLHPGDLVDIVLKKDQPTGKLTRGYVKDILTNTPEHHRGIKVRLQDGQVGRVQAIIQRRIPQGREGRV